MASSGSQPVLDDALAASDEASPVAFEAAQKQPAGAGGPLAGPAATKPAATKAEATTAENATAEATDKASGTSAGSDRATSDAATSQSGQPTTSARHRVLVCLAWLRGLLRSRSTPGWLVSLIIHTGLLLVLALITVAGPGRGGFSGGILEVFAADQAETAVEMVDPMLASGAVSETASDSAQAEAFLAPAGPQTNTGGALGNSILSMTNRAGIGAGEISQSSKSAAGQLNGALSSSMNASLAHVGVDGRKPESRRRLALERGGSGESEAAVELALEWLAAHQKPDGSWTLVHLTNDCGPYCTHPGSKEMYHPAATGLALLAFLGAGYTHREGKYTDNVKRGLYYLLQIMQESDRGGSLLFNSPRGMYNQGIATFALCEAYQLSGDESLKEPAQRAVMFIVNAQNDQGGWGYLPKQPGDLTLTGWQTMALKSADAAGLYIPATSIVKIDQFLDSQGDKNKTFYGYGAPAPKNETCTAIALILRMFRGWPHSDPRVLTAAGYLERQGVSSHDIYRNYYLTLLLYHVGGRTFEEWNPRMRDALIQSQSRDGHAKGSWYFDDPWCEVGGRLYATAMAAMTLEVYYRFSPIYLNSDKPFEF